jgi:Zn-dependent M16 (insulinase) family peptidase
MTTLEAKQKIGNYRVLEVKPLPHLQGQYIRLEHEPTGARHIHIACPDDNNAFCVTFPTVPQDSTGIAHILEHIVLAGSERYPVRDPFFSMIPRSLATFMNALTYPDRTAYPFSTRVEKDYYNLLEVYLDACFFPRIDYEAFRQEGWRYHFAEPENPGSPLQYGGVVLNEMKGMMSTPAYVMFRNLGQAIFPGLTYANNSGGDPRHIPELTWEALKAFHARHYHPSNAYFYSYGNLPLEKTLGYIERHALSRFSRTEPGTAIPDQVRFSAPRRHEATYPLSPSENPDKKSQVLVAWLTTFVGDVVEVLGLSVLQRVLLANAASPLRKALLESKIGEALADGTGFNTTFREAVFAAGLKGVNPEDAERIEELILQTLREVAQNGVDKGMVEAAIHRMELESREVSNQGFPYALKVFFQLSGSYLNGGDPSLALQFDAALERLEAERARGPFFENLIRKHFLDNPHRATIVLRPDQSLTERQEREERERLERVRAALSEAEARRIVEEARALKLRQEAKEDRSVLPTLELSDIPMGFEDVPHSLKIVQGATVGLFPQPTNGISYLDLSFDFSGLSDAQLDLLPLFAFVVTRMGGGRSDYLEMAARIEAHTGGLTAGASLRSLPEDYNAFRQSFGLSGKALYRNHAEFFAILRDLLTELRWDKAHLKNLLGQLKASYEAQIVQAGHVYAMRLAARQFGGVSALRERLEGLSQIATLKRLAALDEAGLDRLLDDLEAIRRQLFRSGGLRICVSAEESVLGELEERLEALLAALPGGTGLERELPGRELLPQARTTAVAVAYNAKLFQSVPYEHPDAPALQALANLLRSEYLHKEIRERGGAYGGFAIFNPESGLFGLLSYRDPHIARSFEVYERIHDFLAQDIEAEKVKEAILGAAGDIDPLLSPDSKGRTRFFDDLAGYTLEKKRQYKERLLQVRLEDLRRVARQYLSGEAALAVISSEEKVKEANQSMARPFEVAAI